MSARTSDAWETRVARDPFASHEAAPRSDALRRAAHDIRTPLAAVTQGVDALMSLDDETSEGAQHLFNIVRRNVLLMGEVLAASIDKPSYRVEASATQIDLIALAKDVADLIQPVLNTRRQTVTVRATCSRAHVVGDHGGIARVLINLLDNASKYGPVGDALAVRVGRRADAVLVSVHDHGPGVPAGERNAVFRAFYRTDAARNSNAPGIGLGLSVVRELVAAHGGSVGVSRVRGETRVWFSLPNKHLGVRE